MKKLLALFVVVAMCAALCACDAESLVGSIVDKLTGGNDSPAERPNAQQEIAFDQQVSGEQEGGEDVGSYITYYPVEGEGSYIVNEGEGFSGSGFSVTVGEDGQIYVDGEAVDMGDFEVSFDDGNEYYYIITGTEPIE